MALLKGADIKKIMELNSPEELIEDIRQGKMVILMDDEDRENEGDLVMAASHVRAVDINFMAPRSRHSRRRHRRRAHRLL